MLTTISVPVFRIHKTGWDEYFVQQRQANGRWKRVSDDYGHITSAKAKLGNLVLALIAEAEEQ